MTDAKSSAVADYLLRLDDAFAAAAGTAPRTEHYRLSGLAVEVRYAGTTLHRQLHPALAHGAAATPAGPDLVIQAWTGEGGGAPPAPGWPRTAYDAYGLARDPDGAMVHIDGKERVISSFDPGRRLACFFLPAATAPVWMRAAPFLQILVWALAGRGSQPLHAAAVGAARGGVLLAGPGGAGKSTTALACLLAGMDFVGDDFVATACEPEPAAACLYATAKVTAQSMALLPSLDASQVELAPGEAKRLVRVDRLGAGRVAERLRLHAIALPRQGDDPGGALRRVPPAAAARALALTSVILLRGRPATALDTASRLARALPCYALDIGRETAPIPDALRTLVERHRPA
jgi:predicted ABC-type transport system involved in lysophospholipase L1 biosynthesis ATPase subunit